MKKITLLKALATSAFVLFSMTGVSHAVDIVWDGGDGLWNSNNWNGGQAANAVFGRDDGLVVGGTEVGTDVFINSGRVTYDPNTHGDLRFVGGGTLNLGAGAVWQQDSNTSPDGEWTEWDGELLNIAGGTFRRTKSGAAVSGGAFILGSFLGSNGDVVGVNVSDGGRIENDGQLWFGTPGSSGRGIEVTMTIDDGHVDLTGGNDLAICSFCSFNPSADLILAYADRGRETFNINFVGPGGTLTVDAGGINAAIETAPGVWNDLIGGGGDGTGLVTYRDLWDVGILQANGESGASGRNFNDFFTVTGVVGQDDYILVSVPEPASSMLMLLAFTSAALPARRFRQRIWTRKPLAGRGDTACL